MNETYLWTGLSLVTPLEARVRGALPKVVCAPRKISTRQSTRVP